MASPFPGMDPYLEDPTPWPHVHAGLIMALHDDLGARLPAKYYVAVEERVYLTAYDDPYFVYPDLAVGHAASGRASEAAAVYKAGQFLGMPNIPVLRASGPWRGGQALVRGVGREDRPTGSRRAGLRSGGVERPPLIYA